MTNNDSNWFVNQINLYQNANNDHDSVKRNFVVRKAEFESIIGNMRQRKYKDSLQHELILGRRGSGKSTLLKRIEIEINEDEKLSQYIAINLAEEQASIYRLFDLWEEVIKELRVKLKLPLIIEDDKAFTNIQDYTRYLFNIIYETCEQQKKKVVLLLDNFDRIVENFNDDGHLLRETLINYNCIQIIGGSTRMDEHFWQYDMPFYEFFRKHRLEALSREEIYELINHWNDSLKMQKLDNLLKNHVGKIENIRILTDGLPRTLQFFIQLLLQKDDLYGYEYLKKIMDYVTPQYQERLNNLTPQIRKIIAEMAFIWEACTTKQLVTVCKMESKLISANLKLLTDKGLVEKIETNKKNHLYRISERFFNMWLIVTQGNPDQKRKANWLSIFLENWYDAHEFHGLAHEHLMSMKDKNIGFDKALVFSKALSQSKHISTKERDELIQETEALNDGQQERFLIELPQKFSELTTEIITLIEEKKYTLALKKFEEIENEDDGIKFFGIGRIYGLLENEKLAEKHYLMAKDKQHVNSMYNLGVLYKNQERFELSEKYFLMAIDNNHIKAMYNLAVLYQNQKKLEKAKKYYLMAIDYGHISAMNNLGIIYYNEGKIELSEKYYLMAADKSYTKAFYNLGLMYTNQKRISEAEKYYMMAVDNEHVDAMYNLGLMYENQQKLDQAKIYYLMAIDKGNEMAMNNLGIVYQNQGEFDMAERYFLMAIEKRSLNAMNNLGLMYFNQQKFEAAEKHFIMAIDNKHIGSMCNLGLMYQKQQHFDQAEKYYLMAIENDSVDALYNLSFMFLVQMKSKELSLKYIRKANLKKVDIKYKMIELIIELWNGIFENVENRASEALQKCAQELKDGFIHQLLIHHQKSIVLRLFHHNQLGKDLQAKHTSLYYATLILNNAGEDNLSLKIPPELNPTIKDIIQKTEEGQKYYYG